MVILYQAGKHGQTLLLAVATVNYSLICKNFFDGLINWIPIKWFMVKVPPVIVICVPNSFFCWGRTTVVAETELWLCCCITAFILLMLVSEVDVLEVLLVFSLKFGTFPPGV